MSGYANPGQPPAWKDGFFPWNYGLIDKGHPARKSAIFVVHGIGEQAWTETASLLRSGFEDAIPKIRHWQEMHPRVTKSHPGHPGAMPPPFVLGGFWANYADFEATFPNEWKKFNEREHKFFSNLWAVRTNSLSRVYWWFIRQQLRLLNPKLSGKWKPLPWLLYLPLQIIIPLALAMAVVRKPRIVTGFLEDVKLYFDPQGMIERTIVQRIDYRVGRQFLRMLNLDWDFRKIKNQKERLRAASQPVEFDRVIWVAHSLGTVISYNVLADLLARATEIEEQQLPEGGSRDLEEQKSGVKKFRASLEHFVTLGSPLEKAVALFGPSLRHWPAAKAKTEDLDWTNFYHQLDPVSGRMRSAVLFGDRPVSNFHMRSGLVPGLAHLKYWTDDWTLRFILSRTFGKKVLVDDDYRPLPGPVRGLIAAMGYLVWAAILAGTAGFAILRFLPWVWRMAEPLVGFLIP